MFEMFEQNLQKGQRKQYAFAQAGYHIAKNQLYNFDI